MGRTYKGIGIPRSGSEHEIVHLDGVLYIDCLEGPNKLCKAVSGLAQEGL